VAPRADEAGAPLTLPPHTRALYADDVLQLVECDDVFAYRWLGQGDARRMERLIEHHIAYLEARAPAKSMSIAEIATDAVYLPDARTRQLIEEHVKKVDPYIGATAVILGAKGFAASAVRTILSAAVMVRRSKYPHRVFDGIDEAAPWLARQRTWTSQRLPDGAALSDWYRAVTRELSAS
jgi:hypothetical protein